MFKTRKEALAIVGSLSAPSKMPCWGYSLPATACKMGQILNKIPDTICSKCYALKGRYVFSNVKAAMYRRLKAVAENPRWTDAMIYLVKDMPYFRWHDSGDIQSLSHFKKIVDVAKATPNTAHWLPTREYAILKEFFAEGNICPSNLIIRISSLKLSAATPDGMAKKYGLVVSAVAVDNFNCPASLQENECKNCRKCWDKSVYNVIYKLH